MLMKAQKTLFHDAVAGWFESAFAAPTSAQAEAWPAIKARRNVLIAAPTGSGKTAFGGDRFKCCRELWAR
jgi:ATP-dependent Lhr-like helicase